jgi:hypothetical protein
LIPSGFLPWNTRLYLSPHTSQQPLVCRPPKSFLLVAAVFAAFALAIPVLLFYDTKHLESASDWWFVAAVSAIVAAPGLQIAWDTLHCRIVADVRGLTFYDLFRTRFVPWTTVQDYGFRACVGKSPMRKMESVLRIGGEWEEIPHSYLGRAELLEVIAKNATQSRSYEWKRLVELDDGVWPKVFEPSDSSGWAVLGYGLFLHVPLFLLCWLGRAWPIFFFYSPMLALLQWALYNRIKAYRSFLDRKIVVTREGLEYIRGAESLFIPWKEIESYHLELPTRSAHPKLCVSESQGHRIEYPRTYQLMVLVQDWATDASTTSWRYLHGEEEMIIGGAASLWAGGQIGIGPKIHHYRTLTVRVFFLLLISLTPIMASMPFLMKWADQDPLSRGDFLSALAFLLGLGIPTLVLLSTYYFASVRCEESGLRQIGLRDERFLRWDEIQEIKTSGLACVVIGKSKTIRFSSLLADFEGLKDEIERRSGLGWSEDVPRPTEASNDSI